MYLTQQDFEDFEGYINISFIAFNIIGTLVCKQMYSEDFSRRTQLLMHWLILLVGVLSLTAIYISELTPDQKWAFLGLIGIVGFCLGGLFNLYIYHEIILLTERNGEDISMNLNISHGLAQLWAGLS